MTITRHLRILVALFALMVAHTASAATLVVNSAGQLTGATGVMVNGTSYDVVFADSTCALAFSGCDQTTEFTFQTQSSANAAAQALLDQVFVDGVSGQFDTSYGLTFGCGTNTFGFCEALIPYGLNTYHDAIFAIAKNSPTEAGDVTFAGGTNTASYDFSTNNVGVLAVFSLTPSAVPEPATWALMLLGFGGIGLAIRRKHERNLATAG